MSHSAHSTHADHETAGAGWLAGRLRGRCFPGALMAAVIRGPCRVRRAVAYLVAQSVFVSHDVDIFRDQANYSVSFLSLYLTTLFLR